jgi:hypothetical protein
MQPLFRVYGSAPFFHFLRQALGRLGAPGLEGVRVEIEGRFHIAPPFCILILPYSFTLYNSSAKKRTKKERKKHGKLDKYGNNAYDDTDSPGIREDFLFRARVNNHACVYIFWMPMPVPEKDAGRVPLKKEPVETWKPCACRSMKTA